jgi:heme exporter protein D
MPLRQWMEERGHPGWYSWLVVIGCCISTLVLSIIINAVNNRRAVDRQQQQQLRLEQALCKVVEPWERARLLEGRPTSPYGRELADGMTELRNAIRCPPTPVKKD